MKKITALALALCLLLSGCGTRLDRQSPLKKLKDDALSAAVRDVSQQAFDALGTQKLSVGILRDGRVSFCSFGGASEDTIYSLGLLTQIFTGIAAQSYLDMDAPAVDYFGESITLPTWNGQELTVGQIATQTAGLPDWPDDLFKGDNPCYGYTDRKFLGYLARTELLYEPGTASADSACSAALLGNLMEWKVGGKAVRDVNLLSTRVVARAGLYSTYLTVPMTRDALRATGYGPDGKVAAYRKYDAMGTAAAGFSSAYDMMVFAAACMDQVSSYDGADPAFPTLARTALSRQYTDENGGRGYCCRVDDFGYGDVAWQQSVLGGFGGYFGLCADAGTAVIVLCNGEASVTELGEQVLALVSAD